MFRRLLADSSAAASGSLSRAVSIVSAGWTDPGAPHLACWGRNRSGSEISVGFAATVKVRKTWEIHCKPAAADCKISTKDCTSADADCTSSAPDCATDCCCQVADRSWSFPQQTNPYSAAFSPIPLQPASGSLSGSVSIVSAVRPASRSQGPNDRSWSFGWAGGPPLTQPQKWVPHPSRFCEGWETAKASPVLAFVLLFCPNRIAGCSMSNLPNRLIPIPPSSPQSPCRLPPGPHPDRCSSYRQFALGLVSGPNDWSWSLGRLSIPLAPKYRITPCITTTSPNPSLRGIIPGKRTMELHRCFHALKFSVSAHGHVSRAC